VDKFEHEKHNRRERVYKFPRIKIWDQSSKDSDELRKKANKEALESRCLALYRDFFRNPRNREYVGESFNSKRFAELPINLMDDLKMGSKAFRSIEFGSNRYKEYMTPRELLFWDDSNNDMNRQYRSEIDSLKEQNDRQKNEDMLRALRRSRFEDNSADE
jgi:hypothetical protein